MFCIHDTLVGICLTHVEWSQTAVLYTLHRLLHSLRTHSRQGIQLSPLECSYSTRASCESLLCACSICRGVVSRGDRSVSAAETSVAHECFCPAFWLYDHACAHAWWPCELPLNACYGAPCTQAVAICPHFRAMSVCLFEVLWLSVYLSCCDEHTYQF